MPAPSKKNWQKEMNRMKADKLIISNRSALQLKYKTAFSDIKKEIDRLILFDKKRGLLSVLCFIDDETAMNKVNGKAISNRKDARSVKLAGIIACRPSGNAGRRTCVRVGRGIPGSDRCHS